MIPSPYLSISFHPKPRASGIVGSCTHKHPIKIQITSHGLNEPAPHKAPRKGGVLEREALQRLFSELQNEDSSSLDGEPLGTA